MNNNSSLTNQELLLHDLQKIPVFKTSDNSYIHIYIYIYIYIHVKVLLYSNAARHI